MIIATVTIYFSGVTMSSGFTRYSLETRDPAGSRRYCGAKKKRHAGRAEILHGWKHFLERDIDGAARIGRAVPEGIRHGISHHCWKRLAEAQYDFRRNR
jgi:hypothetical protein